MSIVNIHDKMFANLVIQYRNNTFSKKMFANATRFMKSTNVFFHERFPIYGLYVAMYIIASDILKVLVNFLYNYIYMNRIPCDYMQMVQFIYSSNS